jgi:hypothetical protein
MAEKWAQHCAKLEKGASGFIFEATQEYAAKYAEGLTYEAIAKAVTAAGFPISRYTVSRRVEALARVEGSGTVTEEDFAKAYADVNLVDSGRTTGFGSLPKNHQGRLLVLQDVVKALVKDNDEDPEYLADLVGGEARAARHKASPQAAPVYMEETRPETPAEANYRLASEALDLVQLITEPVGKKAETKLEVLILEAQVKLGTKVSR